MKINFKGMYIIYQFKSGQSLQRNPMAPETQVDRCLEISLKCCENNDVQLKSLFVAYVSGLKMSSDATRLTSLF